MSRWTKQQRHFVFPSLGHHHARKRKHSVAFVLTVVVCDEHTLPRHSLINLRVEHSSHSKVQIGTPAITTFPRSLFDWEQIHTLRRYLVIDQPRYQLHPHDQSQTLIPKKACTTYLHLVFTILILVVAFSIVRQLKRNRVIILPRIHLYQCWLLKYILHHEQVNTLTSVGLNLARVNIFCSSWCHRRASAQCASIEAEKSIIVHLMFGSYKRTR